MKKALRYNKNKPRLAKIWMGFLTPIARVLEFGAAKYDWDNWKNHLDREEILDSSMRHLASLIDGELHDKESQLHHLGHLACNLMFYWYHYGKGENLYANGEDSFFENLQALREKKGN